MLENLLQKYREKEKKKKNRERKAEVTNIFTIKKGSLLPTILILSKTLEETEDIRQNKNYRDCNRVAATNRISLKPSNSGHLHMFMTKSLSTQKQRIGAKSISYYIKQAHCEKKN